MTTRSAAQQIKLAYLSTLYIVLLTLAILISRPALAQEYKAFSVLGSSQALCKPGIETGEQLQSFFANNRLTVEQVLRDANWQGNSDDLFGAIAEGQFSEKSYPRGTKLEWTSLKRDGIGEALPYRIWAGEQPFEGFEVNIQSQCKLHKMVIPKACCNLSLASITEITTPKPSLEIESNNESVTICTDSGNDIAITFANGDMLAVPTGSNGCWTGELTPGQIAVSATQTDQCGIASSEVNHIVAAAPVTAAATAPAIMQPIAKFQSFVPYIAIFAGDEVRQRYEPDWEMYNEDRADVIGVRAGLLMPLNQNYSAFAQIGYLDRDGVNTNYLYPNDALFLDIGVDRHIGQTGFVGVGAGSWHPGESEYDDVSIFVHGGGGIGIANAQWHIEGRVFGKELDNIDSDHLITAGLRYLFK